MIPLLLAVLQLGTQPGPPPCEHCGSWDRPRPSLDVRSGYPGAKRCPDCWAARDTR